MPLDGESHGTSGIEQGQAILEAHPAVARKDAFIAAIVGDDETLRAFVTADPRAATSTTCRRGTRTTP